MGLKCGLSSRMGELERTHAMVLSRHSVVSMSGKSGDSYRSSLANDSWIALSFAFAMATRLLADMMAFFYCRVPQPRCLRIRQTPFQPSTTILTVALVFITSLFHGTRWKTKITVIKICSHENGEIYRKTKRNENLHCPTPG